MAHDTIAAIATPPGRGGVGVIRISGPDAAPAARRLFCASSPSFSGFKPRFMHHGQLLDQRGRVVDEILAVHMPGPGSFTGEDVVELHCHGGPSVLAAALEALFAGHVRPAEPGEFTRRAFLAGKLDLAQAEAVAEMISAPTRPALSLARSRLAGALSRKVQDLRRRLLDLRAELALAVDFPEDDVESLPPGRLAGECGGVSEALGELLAAAGRARPWREGALVVLAGAVNAGKSSLLNILLGRQRAIVTDLPGTTRDFLEEALDLDGLPVRLVDTAGLREALDPAEQAGLDASRSLALQADLVLLVVDDSAPLPPDALALLDQAPAGRVLAVANKSDLPPADERRPSRLLADKGLEVVSVSALHGDNVAWLAAAIRRRIDERNAEPGPDDLAPNARQAQALRAAKEELDALAAEARQGVPHDLLGVRLEAACSMLAGVTGEIAPDHVLDAIFERFCIGK